LNSTTAKAHAIEIGDKLANVRSDGTTVSPLEVVVRDEAGEVFRLRLERH
jgi:hypothetical protein